MAGLAPPTTPAPPAARAWRVIALVGIPLAAAFLVRAVLDGAWPLLAEAFVVLAACVLVPLAASLSAPSPRAHPAAGARRASSYAGPVVVGVCAALAALSFLAPVDGGVAAALSVPWLVSSLALAFRALRRAGLRGAACGEERAVDVAWLHLVVGATWLVVYRAGVTALGYGGTWALLTAVHFHFAGFAASTIAGLAGRSIPRGAPLRRVWAVSAAVVVVGPALVGIGFVARAQGGAAWVASASGVFLAAGMLGLGVALVRVAASTSRKSAAQRIGAVLVVVAAVGLVVTMALACAYALSLTADLAVMARVHGVTNALGFSTCGIVGLALVAAPSRQPLTGAPHSRWRARFFVGADFPERSGAVDSARAVPRGQLDELASFAWSGFTPALVHPAIRAFYEGTLEQRLVVRARWHPVYRPLGAVWRALARKIGQLGLPPDLDGDEGMTGRLVPIRADVDGRDGVRAWVRTWPNGDVLYVAGYARSESDGVPLLNIALPLPFSSIATLLRFDDDVREPGALHLSSLARTATARIGDEGVYWVTPLGTLRLPLDEVLHVRPAESGEGARAHHELRFLGITFLALDYVMSPAAP